MSVRCVFVALCAYLIVVHPSWLDGRAGARTGNGVAAEKKYSAHHYAGSGKTGSIYFVDHTGASDILIIAPHAVKHRRGGHPKGDDKYTGGIAEMVAEKTGASVLTTTGKVPDWGDWWDNRDDEFTQILRNLPPRVKVVKPSIGRTESAPPSATERSQTTRSSRPPRVTRTPRTCRKRGTSQFSLSFPGANAAAKALSTASPRQSLGSRQLIASPQKVYPQMEVAPKLQGR